MTRCRRNYALENQRNLLRHLRPHRRNYLLERMLGVDAFSPMRGGAFVVADIDVVVAVVNAFVDAVVTFVAAVATVDDVVAVVGKTEKDTSDKVNVVSVVDFDKLDDAVVVVAVVVSFAVVVTVADAVSVVVLSFDSSKVLQQQK